MVTSDTAVGEKRF